MNGTTQCSGDDSSPRNVPNTTHAGEWYHACRGGAPRSESKSIDCQWQSHHNSIGNLAARHVSAFEPFQPNGTTMGESGVAAAICRHPAVRPLVVHSYTKHSTVPAPRRGWMAMNHRRYTGFTVRRTGCSGGNLPPPGRKAIRGTFEFVTSTAKTSVIPTEQSERRNPLK